MIGSFSCLPLRELRLAQVSTSEGRVQNAGGIIYAKEKYILVIMTDKALRKDETMKTINQISSIIFNTVNAQRGVQEMKR